MCPTKIIYIILTSLNISHTHIQTSHTCIDTWFGILSVLVATSCKACQLMPELIWLAKWHPLCKHIRRPKEGVDTLYLRQTNTHFLSLEFLNIHGQRCTSRIMMMKCSIFLNTKTHFGPIVHLTWHSLMATSTSIYYTADQHEYYCTDVRCRRTKGFHKDRFCILKTLVAFG